MRSLSLHLGKLFGIDVYIHWTFWILIGWIILMHLQQGAGFSEGLLGVLFIFALFGCVVLHEFGHALTARRFGVVTKDITLYPIGGIASLEGMPERPLQEFVVAIVGPMVNLVIAAVLWLALSASGNLPDIERLSTDEGIVRLPFLFSLLVANVILAVFNLIPAFPMDGGRALRSLLSLVMERTTATRIAAGLGQFLAITFVFLGFFYNFWLVLIGLFIFLGAGGEAAYVRTQSALAGLTVMNAIMRRFTILKPDQDLGEAIDALLNSQETAFVVSADGKPLGLLMRDDIIRGLSEVGKHAPVSQFMNTNYFVVDPEMPLETFFQKAMTEERSVALVIAGDELLGLIDRENVGEILMIKEALDNKAGI